MSITSETLRDGSVEHIVLASPPANILDMRTVRSIRNHVATFADRPRLRLVVFDALGDHFSFGASVPEHMPDQVGDMLPGFHQLFVALEESGLPTAAVVRGRCLGGGAELATWCGTVHCSPSAAFAVPEVKLAVFPPIAAMAWRWRVGGNKATELILTGRNVRSAEAVLLGLADACSDDPLASVLAWHDKHLEPLSPAAVRFAWRAARAPLRRGLAEELPELERLYLDQLMAHPDALEGLQSFVEKRPPRWSTT